MFLPYVLPSLMKEVNKLEKEGKFEEAIQKCLELLKGKYDGTIETSMPIDMINKRIDKLYEKNLVFKYQSTEDKTLSEQINYGILTELKKIKSAIYDILYFFIAMTFLGVIMALIVFMVLS